MSQQNKTRIVGLIVIVLLTTASTAGAVAYNNASLVSQSSPTSATSTSTAGTSTAPTTTTTTPTVPTTTQPSTSTTTYKDGTYSANGIFTTPDGTEQLGVTVTLASDKITALSIDDSNIFSRESQQYTARFVNGINQLVIGKSISNVNVSRVSGASLTPVGFNNALETIKNDAKA